MTTIKDVARQSGFSITTVSVVLNNAPLARHIPQKTKKRIKDAAEQLGYHPNSFARFLRTKRTHSVGVMVFDLCDPYCAQMLSGIEDTLYRAAYTPILCDIRNSRPRFQRSVGRLQERRIEGLITLSNSLCLETELLEVFEHRDVPVVIIGRNAAKNSISSVELDNEVGARKALDHLLSLGHRRIAFIKGPELLVDSAQRWNGVTSFARKAGLEVRPEMVVHLRKPTHSYLDAFELTRELIRQNPRFTAIMAFDDVTAFGAICALTSCGLRVPEACSVIGFDDVTAAAFYNPPLTTIRQPMETMGAVAASLLIRKVRATLNREPQRAVHRRITPRLVVRQSTAPPRESL